MRLLLCKIGRFYTFITSANRPRSKIDHVGSYGELRAAHIRPRVTTALLQKFVIKFHVHLYARPMTEPCKFGRPLQDNTKDRMFEVLGITCI